MFFIANWKMFGDLKAINSTKKVIKFSKNKKFKRANIVYCPPYTLIEQFTKITKNSNVKVGAQDCHFLQSHGPFTGSINANLLKITGAKYVIIGHSENRARGDTNYLINLKIRAALNKNLKIIFCIGETLKEKKTNKTKLVLKKQIISGLKKVKGLNKIIFAYEPVWCIGTGKIPKIKEIKDQFSFIKKLLMNKFNSKNPIIVYGGSVDPKNIKSLNQISEIKGFLIGGASRRPNKFIDIIKKSII